MSNSQGNFVTTAERAMAAYDRLPRAVRYALRKANYDWAPQPIAQMLARGVSTGDIALSIRHWDRDQGAEDRWEVWHLADFRPKQGEQSSETCRT